MRFPLPPASLLLFSFLPLACATTEEPSVPPGCDVCVLTDAENYGYTSTIDAAVAPLREGADGTIRWDALTTDMRGRPLDPITTVSEAVLLLFHSLSAEEVEAAIAADDLEQEEVGGYFTCDEPDAAACALSSFCLYYACVDPAEHFQADRGTWLVMLRAAGEQGALSLLFLAPEADSAATEAAFTDASATLTLDVDLPAPLRVAEGPAVEVDWSALTRDGLGNTLDPHRIDRLELARYGGTLEELEAGFARLDTLAEATWAMDVSGTTRASLDEMVGEEAFSGVDAEHRWLLALRCTTCSSPYPPIVTALAR